MQDFNPNVRLEKYSEYFEIPVSRPATLYRSLVSILVEDVKIRGLDLSHWNDDNNIDFVALKANGIDFVILKVTEATYFTDDTFKTKYERALAAGVIVMPYHFFRSNYGGTAQAKYCIDALKTLGFLDAISYVPIVWADVETSDGVGVSTRRNRLRIFLEEVEIQGFQGGVYSSLSYWNTLIGTVTWISKYWQWAAHWTSANYPSLPINWTKEKSLFWQNGIHPAHSWVETVIGASGNVDHNYFFGTLADLKALLKFTIPPTGDCNCEEEISVLHSEIARLETEVNFSKVEIYNLQQKDLEIESDVTEAFDLIDSNVKDIYKLKQKDNDLDTAIEMLTTDIEAIESALMAQGDLLTRLESRLNLTETSIDTLNLTVANLDVRISDLETTEAEIRAVYNK